MEEEYHDLSGAEVAAAMEVMDAGLIREGYYAELGAKIPKPKRARTGSATISTGGASTFAKSTRAGILPVRLKSNSKTKESTSRR